MTRGRTLKNKECGTSVLLELGLNNSSFILLQFSIVCMNIYRIFARCGINITQRKANSLCSMRASVDVCYKFLETLDKRLYYKNFEVVFS